VGHNVLPHGGLRPVSCFKSFLPTLLMGTHNYVLTSSSLVYYFFVISMMVCPHSITFCRMGHTYLCVALLQMCHLGANSLRFASLGHLNTEGTSPFLSFLWWNLLWWWHLAAISFFLYGSIRAHILPLPESLFFELGFLIVSIWRIVLFDSLSCSGLAYISIDIVM